MSRTIYLKRDSNGEEFTNELYEDMVKSNYEFHMRERYDSKQKRRDPNHTIVHWAVKYADSTSAQLIIAKYPQFIKVADADGMTPLHYLAECTVSIGDYDSIDGINAAKEIMTALKLAGADLNANSNQWSKSPLYSAIGAYSVTNPEIVRHLLQLGANINLPGPAGQKPIHYLLNWGHNIEEVLPVLAEFNADFNEVVNMRRGYGVEPLSPIDIVLIENKFSNPPYRKALLVLLASLGAVVPTMNAELIRLCTQYPELERELRRAAPNALTQPAPAALTFAAPTFNPSVADRIAANIAANAANNGGILRTIKAKFGLASDAPQSAVEEPISQIEYYISQQPDTDMCRKFICPVHLGLMLDPVNDANGVTSDRVSAEQWRARNNNTSVSHRGTMTNTHLNPNCTVRDFIINFIETNVTAIKELAANREKEAANANAAQRATKAARLSIL